MFVVYTIDSVKSSLTHVSIYIRTCGQNANENLKFCLKKVRFLLSLEIFVSKQDGKREKESNSHFVPTDQIYLPKLLGVLFTHSLFISFKLSIQGLRRECISQLLHPLHFIIKNNDFAFVIYDSQTICVLHSNTFLDFQEDASILFTFNTTFFNVNHVTSCYSLRNIDLFYNSEFMIFFLQVMPTDVAHLLLHFFFKLLILLKPWGTFVS